VRPNCAPGQHCGRCSCSPPRARSRTGSPAWDAGADDYLVKTLSAPRKLLARVRGHLLRRFQRQHKAAEKLRLGEIEIGLGPADRRARQKKQIHLTAKEFAMLRLMAEAKAGRSTRERFPSDAVWGYAAFPDNAHGGQSHRQPAGQAGAEPGRTRAGSRP